MTVRFLDVDLTDAEIARVARFLRRKAEQTCQNAMALRAATSRVAEEAKHLVASARAASDAHLLTSWTQLDAPSAGKTAIGDPGDRQPAVKPQAGLKPEAA